MLRELSKGEITTLKRAFNQWRIFEELVNLEILANSHPEGDSHAYSTRPTSSSISIGSENNTGHIVDVYVTANKKNKSISIKIQPVFSGLKIGQVKNKKFFPNLNFAELVIELNPMLDFPYIMLDDKSSNLVTYGRDIMGGSIISHYKDIEENQILIVLNKHKEVLAIGRSRFRNGWINQNNKITVDIIQDIGTYYLKHEDRGIL
jgi:60S ribosome subunit biogenesis protein NIP7